MVDCDSIVSTVFVVPCLPPNYYYENVQKGSASSIALLRFFPDATIHFVYYNQYKKTEAANTAAEAAEEAGITLVIVIVVDVVIVVIVVVIVVVCQSEGNVTTALVLTRCYHLDMIEKVYFHTCYTLFLYSLS